MSGHVDPRELADSGGEARRAMLEHVRACATCRKSLAAADPSALFGLLALAPIPAEALKEVSAKVVLRIESERLPASWPRRAAAAAIFVITILTGYATLHDRPVAPQQAQRTPQRADVEVGADGGVSQVIDLTVGETQLIMVYNGDLRL